MPNAKPSAAARRYVASDPLRRQTCNRRIQRHDGAEQKCRHRRQQRRHAAEPIEADVDPRNSASIRTVERLGFEREGYLRERWQVNGEIQDALFFGLLRPDWEA